MERIQEMTRIGSAKSGADIDALAECIEACTECAQTCIACADACLGEDNVKSLIQCIRLNQDCSDICETTERLLSRASESSAVVIQSLMQACIAVCRECGSECSKHADHHEHCRVCAESCQECTDACSRALSSMLSQS